MLFFVIQILWLCLIRNLMMWSSCILSAGCIRSTESLVFLFSTSSKCFSQPSTTRSELLYTKNTAMTESALLKIIIWIICKQMARNTNTLSYNHHLSLWLPILHCTCLCCSMLMLSIERTWNVSPYLLHSGSKVPAGLFEEKRIALWLKHLV